MNNRGPALLISSLLTFLLSVETCLLAGNWPGWRGPTSNGVAEAGKFPTEWSVSKNSHIAWAVKLPGAGGSTPVAWGELLFVTYCVDGNNVVLCVNGKGQELWKTTVGKERTGKHKKATGANSSPVTDGKSLFVYFKSGDFAALDFEGKVVWQKNLQKEYAEDTLWWDLGTSPVLTSQHVVVACVQTGPSYVVAFDKETGKEVWKQDRKTDAPEEAAQTYSTPMVTNFSGQEQIVVLGADTVTCHGATDGKELWRVGGLNPGGERFFRSIASPVIDRELVIAPYARGNTLTAIRLGGSGDVSSTHVVWSKKALSADVPTPTALGGRAYICTDKGVVACLEEQTGDVAWKHELPGNRNAYSASPILANGKLYLTREDGVTYVVDAENGEPLGENDLNGEMIVATPVFTNGHIYLRTHDTLFCVGE